MPSSIINSDNGLVSGVQGLKSTGGDDGVLILQSSGTETARVTSAGNVLVPTVGAQMIIGHTTTPVGGASLTVQGTAAGLAAVRYTDTAGLVPYLNHYKSRGATIGTPAAVQNGDSLGRYTTYGYNSTAANYLNATNILAEVDGVPGAASVPGRMIFQTADSAGTLQNRMRIHSDGTIAVNTSSVTAGYQMEVNGRIKATNVDGPAFYAYASASTNMASNAQTQINFATEDYDTNNNYNTTNSRFTPTIAGYYLITGTVRYDASSNIVTHLYINHSALGTIGTGGFVGVSAGQTASSGSTIAYFNGSTDYVTLSAYVNVGGNNIITGRGNTYFTGCFLRT